MVRLLIVDDHAIVSQGLKHFVEHGSNNAMTTETCPSQEARKRLHENAYDVVLLGNTVSAVEPLELLKQTRAEHPKLPVLVLSPSEEEQHCRRLLRAGASGILTRQSAASELMDAIVKVSGGRKYVSPSLAEVLSDFSDDEKPLLDTLSDREYEVMVAIASGRRMKQIADGMSLSIKTVSTYHSRILEKLKFSNDAQLIRYAIEQGVIRNGVLAREKLILNELNIRTAPVIESIRAIWRHRKAIIIVVGLLSIATYIFLTYVVKFVF